MALDLIIESIHQEIAKRGHPTDKTFDALFPSEIRKLSGEFWSSTAVSLKVANFLCEENKPILDIGSGSGKFCLMAAILFPECEIVGVEHRPSLVAVSRMLRKELQLNNLSFICGDAFKVTWSKFHALYFYNPFEEQTYTHENLGYSNDALVSLDTKNYHRFGVKTKARLNRLKEGSKVAIYNGFHKTYTLPESFKMINESVVKGSQLALAAKILV